MQKPDSIKRIHKIERKGRLVRSERSTANEQGQERQEWLVPELP